MRSQFFFCKDSLPICTKARLNIIKKFLLETNKNLKNISVCLETAEDLKEFENILGELR